MESPKHPTSIDFRAQISKVVAFAMALLLAACAAPAATPAGPREMIDGLGRQISLELPVERIVSLAPSNTEMLFEIGAGSQVVGRDEASDYPAQALEVASIGNTFGELNTEAILALEPNLVLAADITAPEQLQSLEALGLTTFVISNPMQFDGLYENLITLGEITGHSAAAADLVEGLRGRVEDVTVLTDDVLPTTVFYEIDGSDPNAPWTTGSGTFQDLLIEMAGGTNVASDIQGWGQIDLEQVVLQDPEVIVFAVGPFIATTSQALSERAGWSGLEAVQSGRVYPIDTNWVDRPGPRLVDGLEAFARALHPDLFK
ncbi:MAG: ABC transporter substrate-binding protein [Anaerolineales bacterium]